MPEVAQRAAPAAPSVSVQGSALVVAASLPALLAFNLPPSSTMLNQCLATGLWGAVVAAGTQPMFVGAGRALQWAVAALLVGLIAALTVGGLPSTLALATAGVLLASAFVAMQAAACARASSGAGEAFAPFAIGLVVAAALSTVVALVQAFLPDLPDGDLIARSGLPGRAVGNLRQPNHLCSLLLWGVIAVVALLEMRRLALQWAALLVALMVFAVELSASRTGAVGLGLLAAWGLLDGRLSRPARVLLVLTPVIYALSYGAMALYGHWTDQAFGAEARLATGEATSESPNSRKRIWANALTLIAQQPWTGVGFGEFNIAWSLTAFPGRPTAFFDHTHNLPLELAVELGLPLAALVLGLLVLALWQAWRRSGEATGDAGTAARAAFMLVLMIGLHSMSEYPLWYAYFLLPTAFAWGFALGSGGARKDDAAKLDATFAATAATAQTAVTALTEVAAPTTATAATALAAATEATAATAAAHPRVTPTAPSPPASSATNEWRVHASRILGLLLVIGSVYAVFDYLRIAAIYSPGTNAAPLNERIAAGQRSLLFGHHADYAAATSPDPLPGRELAFRRATHHLLDTRLMQAWAEYLAETGELDKARWLAQRLREFRNPASDDFFAPCADATSPPPFQCQPPQRSHAWREFAQR